MKKTLCLLLTFIMLCPILTACFDRGETVRNTDPKTAYGNSAAPTPGTTGTTQPETKPTEPEPTEPAPTEPEATEPPPTEPEDTEPEPTETQPVASEPTLGDRAAAIALEQLGKEYLFGTAGPDTFDASGLVQYCYAQLGISLPRSTATQAATGTEVALEDLLPGDAVFFWNDIEGEPQYVGIYVGDGQFVCASTSARPVSLIDMTTNYYITHFVCARRFYGQET